MTIMAAGGRPEECQLCLSNKHLVRSRKKGRQKSRTSGHGRPASKNMCSEPFPDGGYPGSNNVTFSSDNLGVAARQEATGSQLHHVSNDSSDDISDCRGSFVNSMSSTSSSAVNANPKSNVHSLSSSSLKSSMHHSCTSSLSAVFSSSIASSYKHVFHRSTTTSRNLLLGTLATFLLLFVQVYSSLLTPSS